MNNELILSFREKINENDTVYHLYHNCNGKNQWSVICSAVDWIETVVSSIDIKKLSRKNDNNASVKMITFVACIDILWESIIQLHRVFFNTDAIPFAEDNSVFKNKLFATSDNKYFKTIRACFATHPVNVNDCFGDGRTVERRYAGWSGGGFGRDDFSVCLYSNIPGKDDIIMTICFDELMEFAAIRYNYLKTIIKQIDKRIMDYHLSWQKQYIQRSMNINEQIEILIDESKKRFSNDYYFHLLTELQIIFSVEIRNENNLKIVDHLRKNLIPAVNEILQYLQNMEIREVESMNIMDMLIPRDCHYDFSKISDAVFGGYSYFWSLARLKAYLNEIVNLDDYDSIAELYVIIQAGFLFLNGKQ